MDQRISLITVAVDDVARSRRFYVEGLDWEPALGGYSGYFGDPDGYRWEIACAPGPINDIVVPQRPTWGW